MNNLVKRILLFVIAIPSLILLVFLGDIYYFLPVNITVFVIGGLASYEMTKMFKAMNIKVNVFLMIVTGSLIPFITWIQMIGLIGNNALMIFLMLLVIFVFIMNVIKPGEKGFSGALPSMSASLMIIFYPGLFLSYITRITFLPNSSIIMFIFICAVYLNDSNAWLFGVLWGKKSRGFVAVSPNKSLMGFIGGILASIIVTVSSKFLFPAVITGSIPLMVVLGIVAGVTAIIGDLVESGMKRSSGVKDSGDVVPGRGGVLDSVDSLIFAAPGFYYVILLATAGL
ncbi:MAG: phosphatidate cytidylyltransferase [Spirochaetaceae bacterium]|nr:phosphatidate cytidylyltransferase [Spirochaetaceae bacterium]